MVTEKRAFVKKERTKTMKHIRILASALALCVALTLAACGSEPKDNGGESAGGELAEAEKTVILTLASAMMSEGAATDNGEITVIDSDTVEVTFKQEGDTVFCVTLNKTEEGSWVADPTVTVLEETTAEA